MNALSTMAKAILKISLTFLNVCLFFLTLPLCIVQAILIPFLLHFTDNQYLSEPISYIIFEAINDWIKKI